eukprot:8379659-Alexandrium_andersonii.AAC.1
MMWETFPSHIDGWWRRDGRWIYDAGNVPKPWTLMLRCVAMDDAGNVPKPWALARYAMDDGGMKDAGK